MIISAFIKGQSLTLPRAKIVAGSNDYQELRAVFQTGDWSGLNVYAHFTQDGKNIFDVQLVDGYAGKDQHINLAAGTWKLYFTGHEIDGAMRITTEQQQLEVQATGFVCGPFPEIPLSHAEQVTQEAARARKLAEETRKIVVDNAPLTDRAEEAAQSAEADARQAATAAASAQESRDNAAGSASSAAGSAKAAQESQESAKGSMDSAGLSSQQASRDATSAAKSAQESATSAAAAAGSEGSVKADANRAGAEATRAVQAAETATKAAASAEDDAGFAKESKEAAANSATAASASAGQAAASEKTAQRAATNASGSADQAQTDALTATEAAKSAQAEAGKAKSEADKAAQSAADAKAIIQDNTLSTGTTWSSDKVHSEDGRTFCDAIEATCQPFQKSGPVVTCDPVAGYPLSVKSQLVPRQEGSGDPSPENVRPILPTGNVSLAHFQKNLFDKSARPHREHAYITEEGKYSSTDAFIVARIIAPKGSIYVTIGNSRTSSPAICFFDADNNFISGEKYRSRENFAISVPDKARYIEFSVGIAGIQNALDTFQIEIGAVQTPYAPYIGETYTAALPPDTYGGEVDWEKKTLSPGIAYDILANFDYVNKSPGVVGRFAFDIWRMPPEIKVPYDRTKSLCMTNLKHLTSDDRPNLIGFWASSDAQLVFNFKDTVPDSLEGFKTYLEGLNAAGTPMMFYGERKNPIYVPITPSGTPTAIPGVNTLYSDTGDTTVSGRESPIYANQQRDARISALEDLITQKSGGM